MKIERTNETQASKSSDTLPVSFSTVTGQSGDLCDIMVKTIPKRSCCEAEDEKPTGAKKVVKKIFNFFFGCCKNKK